MTVGVTWLAFILTAAAIVRAGISLSRHSDIIARETNLGGVVVGSIFLACATSLPEIATGVSSGLFAAPDIAVGNVLGSNLFNLAILAVADWFEGPGGILARASRDHRYPAALGLVLMLMTAASISTSPGLSVQGVGIDTLVIGLTYLFGLFVIRRRSNQASEDGTHSLSSDEPNLSSHSAGGDGIPLKQVIIRFVIAALLIIFAGAIMSRTADRISVITGLGGTFVGSILVAAATSLPELVASITAVRLGAVDLAVGNVLGSNLFNMLILVAADLSFRGAPLLSKADPAHSLTATAGGVLTAVILISLSRSRTRTPAAQSRQRPFHRLGLDTAVVLVGYLCATFILYTQ